MATASGSGPNPAAPTALSDEQAEQFAASFTPSWDTDGDDVDPANGAANATLVDAPAVGAAQAAAVVNAAPAAPAHVALSKQTLIGTAPQANAPFAPAGVPSSESIDPENILESRTAPQPPVKAAAAPAAPTTLKGTQPLQAAPAPYAQAKAQSRPPPAPGPAAKNARVAVNADPFAVSAGPRPRGAPARPLSDDLDDFVPKKSSKTIYAVIAGLAIAAGLGLFLKFALSDDTPKPPVEQHATGPAVTTAEIPPPPPKVDTPPPSTPTTAATTAAKVDPAPPATLPAPPTARAPDPPAVVTHAAAAPPPRSEPRPRTPPPPPPPAAVAPPAPVTPKTPPKANNGSIVRDNPF